MLKAHFYDLSYENVKLKNEKKINYFDYFF